MKTILKISIAAIVCIFSANSMCDPDSLFNATRDDQNTLLSDKRAGAQWTKEEDNILLKNITECNSMREGGKRTHMILPHRTVRQCIDRYNNYLKTDHLKCHDWTAEEDAILINKLYENGTNWKRLAENLPNKDIVMVKNRYHKLCMTLFEPQREKTFPDIETTIRSTIEDSAYSDWILQSASLLSLSEVEFGISQNTYD